MSVAVSALVRRVALLAVTLTTLLLPRVASAYPWMLRHGYQGCGTCHADPSGGELLTPYGRAQSDLLLRMRYDGASAAPATAAADDSDDFDDFDAPPTKAEPAAPAAKAESPGASAGFLWGLFEPPDALLLGGAYRHALTVSDGAVKTFPMQADLFAQLRFGPVRFAADVGVAKVKPGSPHARAAQVTGGQGDQLNLLSRVHWVGVDLSPEWLLRAGRVNLPFGVRIPEHVLWARDATHTDRESDQQHGVALSYSGDGGRGELMLIAGNYQIHPDEYRERGYSAFFEVPLGDRLAFGASSLFTHAAADRYTLDPRAVDRQVHGVFTRLVLADRIALLHEFDVLMQSHRDLGYVDFSQLDFELVQGLHLMLTTEVLDRGYAYVVGHLPPTPGFGEPKVGGWASVDWFLLPHVELRVDAIARQSDPFLLLAQLHAFL